MTQQGKTLNEDTGASTYERNNNGCTFGGRRLPNPKEEVRVEVIATRKLPSAVQTVTIRSAVTRYKNVMNLNRKIEAGLMVMTLSSAVRMVTCAYTRTLFPGHFTFERPVVQDK